MSSTNTAVLNAMIQYYKCISECYPLYSNARKKLGPYWLIFNKGFKPKYFEFLFDGRGEIYRKEFEKCVKILKLFLVYFPYLKADY